jgi:cell division protease FtsH
VGVLIAAPWSWLHDIPSIAERWLPLMFFLCMVAIVYLLWRTLAVMPRVRPTHVQPGSRQSVSLDVVAGVTEAKAELQEVIDFLKDPKRFEQLGAKVPKGILLYGPPGTGKTLLAKGVAGESGARFFSQSASAFVEMFVGLGASRMRKLFDEARKHAPSIIFIDELDAVGAARTGQGFTREQDQTLNQLLVELDGFHPADQVVVMAASNRLQDLDPALLRPGRFDRQMLVGPPDLNGREAILHVHTRNKPLAADVDLAVIARQTSGLTGADLANIANEAAIFAGRRGARYLSAADFDSAIERVVAGLQQKKVLTEKERRILAFHEAGHALMSHLMGEIAPVQKVTIVSRGTALGYTLNLPSEDRYLETKEELIDMLKIALAGRAAEQVVFGRVTNGAASDLEKATEIARAMVFEWGMSDVVTSRTLRADNYALSEETKRVRDIEQARLTDEAYAEAVRLLEKHRAPLDRLTVALLEKETINREEVMHLLADVEPESRASETVGTPRVVPLPHEG